MSALNWSTTVIPLRDFGSDQAIDNATNGASTTWYGDEVGMQRRVVEAKFFGESAITGDTTAHFDIGIYAGSQKLAEVTFHTGTNHTANDFTELTLTTDATSADTQQVIAADTTLTCGCVVTGSPTMLHTNSHVVVTWAPVQPF